MRGRGAALASVGMEAALGPAPPSWGGSHVGIHLIKPQVRGGDHKGAVAALVANATAARGIPKVAVAGGHPGPQAPPMATAVVQREVPVAQKPADVVAPKVLTDQGAKKRKLGAEVVIHSGPPKARMPRGTRSPVWARLGGLFELADDPLSPGPQRATCVDCGWSTAYKESGGTNKMRRHMEATHKRSLIKDLPSHIAAVVKATLEAVGHGSNVV